MNPWTGLLAGHSERRAGPCRKSPRFETAARLLEDGGMTLRELREVTGWKTNAAAYVLFYMVKDGVVTKTGRPNRYVYELAR